MFENPFDLLAENKLVDIINENERLRAENEKLKSQPIVADLQSETVNAFRQSEQYRSMETYAFTAFLQERFMQDFQRSPFGKNFIETVQAEFKKFELNYNKEEKSDEQSNPNTNKPAPKPIVKKN